MQVAKKISKLILPDDLSVNIEHKSWHGKQPTTLTAVTLYIATHLGSRVMSPGVPVRTISEVCCTLLVTGCSAPGMWSANLAAWAIQGFWTSSLPEGILHAGSRCLRGVCSNSGVDIR